MKSVFDEHLSFLWSYVLKNVVLYTSGLTSPRYRGMMDVIAKLQEEVSKAAEEAVQEAAAEMGTDVNDLAAAEEDAPSSTADCITGDLQWLNMSFRKVQLHAGMQTTIPNRYPVYAELNVLSAAVIGQFLQDSSLVFSAIYRHTACGSGNASRLSCKEAVQWWWCRWPIQQSRAGGNYSIREGRKDR